MMTMIKGSSLVLIDLQPELEVFVLILLIMKEF